MGTSEAVVDFQVLPQPHLCRAVRLAVIDFARRHAVGEHDLETFSIALGEALANAVEHGQPEEPIAVEVRIGQDRIVATVQDHGLGFHTDLAVAPALPPVEAERGRGLPLMRCCSDIFAINSVPGQGTAVVLGRYLREAAAATSVA